MGLANLLRRTNPYTTMREITEIAINGPDGNSYAYISKRLSLPKWTLLKLVASEIQGSIADNTNMIITYPNKAKVQVFAESQVERMRGICFHAVAYDGNEKCILSNDNISAAQTHKQEDGGIVVHEFSIDDENQS